ncbi:MAG: hypothetical protein HYX76_10600 [Acidobacteria bacterium]|nr:hypothetical protein [Acidobacteriota bacterium]
MLPDLERLIRLQELENATEQWRRAIAEIPQRLEAIDTRIVTRSAELGACRQRLSDNQARRRSVEKDLSVVQGRLTKFKDQLMEVKTNKEYQAVQKEIATGEHEVRSFEDCILELMIEADDLTAALKQQEAEFAAEQAEAARERTAIDQERARLGQQLAGAGTSRAAIVSELSPSALALFEHVARLRRGIAVAEARNGLCTICHVRLRPQVFNEIRRNDALIQCDSCQRILYFTSATTAA